MKELTTLLKALADESRLRILSLLLKSGELCVCDIESTMGCTQTKVSRHLAFLRNAGLVKARRQGLWILYSIAEPKSETHRQLLRCLASILEDQPVTGRDTKVLAQNVKRGCCATFTVIKPNSLPSTLTFTNSKGSE